MMNDSNALQSLSLCESLDEDQIGYIGFQSTASVSNNESVYWYDRKSTEETSIGLVIDYLLF